ncbi:hypothetical protein C8J56DRAFT_1171240 [Mycena floridula]|nr:hypothetical protein C8J56DRAFT_1171240 [Mycena floridula]
MANYLPVLLVSVTTNHSFTPVSDDLSLETVPRGQVDYLSHDWEEEDVWRSWRNMTRQKNEIANGMRLENASWRTWWKQRNKLKTVTPETLNWLKDSDVTWLYGPLHTAVDWSPPPKPKSDPTSVEKEIPNSALDRLDLSTPGSALKISRKNNSDPVSNIQTRHKSILKYRSISELLTSDLPPSIMGVSPRSGMSPRESDDEDDDVDEQSVPYPKRSPLFQTKSESHISRSSGHHALAALGLRRSSPPRTRPTSSHPATSSEDSSDLAPESTPSGSTSPEPQLRENGTAALAYSRPKKKAKHIAFNTFVEQCIAIEKPKSSKSGPSNSRPGLGYERSGNWNGKTKGMRWNGIEDDDEDEESGSGDPANGFSSDSSSESLSEDEEPASRMYPYTPQQQLWYEVDDCAIGSDSDETGLVYDENVFEDDEDDLDYTRSTHKEDVSTETRASRNQLNNNSSSSVRSQSKASDSSSSSTSTSNSGISTTETSPSPSPKGEVKDTLPQRRRSHGRKSAPGDSQPHLHHRLSTSSQSSNSTIMPRRKSFTSSAFASKLDRRKKSSRSNSHQTHNSHVTIAPIAPTMLKTTGVGNAWDSFGVAGYQHHAGSGAWVDGFGDEGYSDDGGAAKWFYGKGKTTQRSESSDAGTPVELVYLPPIGRYGGTVNRKHSGKRRSRRQTEELEADEVMLHEPSEQVYHHQEAYFTMDPDQSHIPIAKAYPVPIVVHTPPVIDRESSAGDEAEEDAYDYFAGPDLGEDFIRRPSYSGRKKLTGKMPDSAIAERLGQSSIDDERPSRSRSRTPSPALIAASSSSSSSIPVARPASLQTSSSFEQISSSALLSPPLRGRSLVLPQEPVARGRSSTRTSSSLSDREGSTRSSPIGSLSPEGTSLSIASGAYGIYANGRAGKEGERGRDRTSRRVGQSPSPETALVASPTAATRADSKVDSSSSVSSSSSNTAVPGADLEDEAKRQSTTPSNSPNIGFSSTTAKVVSKLESKPPSPTVLTSPRGPSTSVSSSPALSKFLVPSPTRSQPEANIVGRAVGIVSTAGAFLGLWNGEPGI